MPTTHGREVLNAVEVRCGPTTITVASNTEVEIPGGEVQFLIPLSGDQPLATITALEMNHVSAPMPSINLKQAIESLHDSYLVAGNDAKL